MAPRRKVVASKRKAKGTSNAPADISSGSESSYAPPPKEKKRKGKAPIQADIQRFCDAAAERRFETDYSKRIILIGKFINFNYFAANGLNLCEFFDYLGWTKFLQIDGKVYDILVSEFYANMIIKPDDSLHTLLKGTTFCISEHLLAEVYGFNMDLDFLQFNRFDSSAAIDRMFGEDSNITLSHLTAIQLPPIARLLHKIIVKNLCPRAGKFDSVSAEHLFIIDALLQRSPVYLPSIMIRIMKQAVTDVRSLPYGVVLTQLFQYCDIDLTDEPSTIFGPSFRLDEKTLRLMHLGFVDGQLVKVAPLSHSNRAPAQGESIYTTNNLLRALQASVSDLHVKVDDQGKKIQEIDDSMMWIRHYFEE